MKKIIFSLISLILGITLFFWLLGETGWQGIKNTVLRLSGREGSFLLLLGILGTILGTLRWREILKSKGYYFRLKELYGYYLASFAITYLAPVVVFGGELFRGYILNFKEKNSTSLNAGIAASFINGIFECAFEWLVIFLGIISFFFTTEFPLRSSYMIIFVILLFLGGGLMSYFILKKKSLVKFFFKVDENNRSRKIEKEVFAFFDIKSKVFQKALLFSFAKTTLRLFQYWILIEFLGKSISLGSAISVLGVSVLSMAPPISADLGTHDLGSAILFKNLGIGQEAGIVFASIVRGINLILSIAGIVFLIKVGIATLRRQLLIKIDQIFLNNNSNNWHEHEK